jgi:hypothetical protein
MTHVREIETTNQPAWFLNATYQLKRALPFTENHRDDNSVCIRHDTYCCGEDMRKYTYWYECVLCSRIALVTLPVASLVKESK